MYEISTKAGSAFAHHTITPSSHLLICRFVNLQLRNSAHQTIAKSHHLLIRQSATPQIRKSIHPHIKPSQNQAIKPSYHHIIKPSTHLAIIVVIITFNNLFLVSDMCFAKDYRVFIISFFTIV